MKNLKAAGSILAAIVVLYTFDFILAGIVYYAERGGFW